MKAQQDKQKANTSAMNDGNDSNEDNSLGKKIWGVFSYVIFFAVVIGLFLSVGDGPRVVGGYGVFNVLTRSMQSTIPKDSLVITKSVDAREIKIGDDITFMAGPTATITHRVIAIDEDYMRSGMRGFTTQGTDNATKDKDVTPENNVVGKVIWHNYYLGVATVFLQDNWYFIVAYLAMFMLIKKIILKFMGDEEEEEEDPEEEPQATLNVPPHANRYDTGLWDASSLYEQPQVYDPNTGMYNPQGAYTVDAYGNPVPYNQDQGMNYNGVQYDQYGQPLSYDYGVNTQQAYGGAGNQYPEYNNQMDNTQSYGTPSDSNQQW